MAKEWTIRPPYPEAGALAQALGLPPVQIFDREGTGLAFFAALVVQQTPFITWEKDADAAHLRALAEHDFTASVHLNGTDYRLLEETRACVHVPEGKGKDAEKILREILEKMPKTLLRRDIDDRLATLGDQ